MSDPFVRITPEGRFALDGKRWYCNSAVYYGRHPGTCGADWWRNGRWELNAQMFDADFGAMAEAGLNHAAMFFHNDMFFDNGHVKEEGMERMDRIVAAAKKAGLRISLFIGPFLDTPEAFRQITGETWTHGNRFLPAFNPTLHEAYVMQMLPFARRYRSEPAVLAYTDRIDRFFKGFDNTTVPHNLKEEWIAWLRARYGSFAALLEAVGGAERLENRPRDWGDILLPHESVHNAGLRNPLARDFVLMQKRVTGEAHAAFDRRINEAAPDQFVWTPFEGNTTTWAMLDGFSPEPRKLQAIWMEYYFFETTRPSYVHPFEEWAHTPEVVHRRLSHELPVVFNAAYLMCRYLKLSVGRPVVICHGGWEQSPAYGTSTREQCAAILDRVNAACLAADGDGWHYWNWTDDAQSWVTTERERFEAPTDFHFYGESLGLNDYHGRPKPAMTVVTRYSRELRRRALADRPPKKSDALLLSSAPRMYSLFRRLAVPTAAAVNGALMRCGVEPDCLWSARNDLPLAQETLDSYRFVAIADNLYERDDRGMPERLLAYVEQGGVLYFPLDRWDRFRDAHGVEYDCPALRRLSGVRPDARREWPGHDRPCRNWPFPGAASQEPNLDIQSFPRLAWGICPPFRQQVPRPEGLTLLGFRSIDADTFTSVPGLVPDAEVIAVGKFPAGTLPFVYRHPVGKGWVYVNAWTNNLFRDSESRADYGGWEFDWILDIPLAHAGVRDADLTRGPGFWLRNTWGYFWRDL